MALQATMINPMHDVREQVESTNESSGGLPPLDIEQYLSRQAEIRLGYMYDNAAAGEKDEILINATKPIMASVLVTDHHIRPDRVEDLIAKVFQDPKLHPSQAFNEETIDHVKDYLQHAYKEVRLALFTANMRIYQKIHRRYEPVEKLDYFSVDDLLSEMENPDRIVTQEEAELAFQRDPMMAFAIMYAMSSHKIFDTVQIPEFRAMFMPMAYQLWKKVILEPSEQAGEIEGGSLEAAAIAKKTRAALRNQTDSI